MAKQAKKVEKMDLSASATNWYGAGFDLKRMADLAVRFPIGTRVKYLGTQGKHHGKTGTVVWYVDANGLHLKFEDGSPGQSIPGNVERVAPPNMAPNQVSALLRFLADYLDKALKSK
jgi:hypothetical protein